MAALLWQIRTCLPLILFTESPDVRSGVRIAVLLAALLARSFEFGRCDVPVRPAFPGDGMEVPAEILQSGPAEGPVDVVDDKTGLTPHKGTESCKFAFSH